MADGKRVLVVEDDPLVAMLVEDMLDEIGYVQHENATTVGRALKAVAAGGFDLAILDVNLGGDEVFPVAEALKAARIPFVFASGYGKGGLPQDWAAYPVAAKPFLIDDLDTALAQAMA